MGDGWRVLGCGRIYSGDCGRGGAAGPRWTTPSFGVESWDKAFSSQADWLLPALHGYALRPFIFQWPLSPARPVSPSPLICSRYLVSLHLFSLMFSCIHSQSKKRKCSRLFFFLDVIRIFVKPVWWMISRITGSLWGYCKLTNNISQVVQVFDITWAVRCAEVYSFSPKGWVAAGV